MPTARDFRYTVCGLAYVLFTTFFILMYNGTPAGQVIAELKKWDSISIISLVFSAPVIGIFIGVIAYGILFLFCGYRIVYYVPVLPREDWLVEKIIEKHKREASDNVLKEIAEIDRKAWRRKDHSRFMKYYQHDVRTLIKEGSAEYLERRWAVLWTHINMMAGILAAFFTASVYAMCNKRDYDWAMPEYYVVIGIIGLASYILSATYNAVKTYETGRDVEHYMLNYKYNFKSEPQEINVKMMS